MKKFSQKIVLKTRNVCKEKTFPSTNNPSLSSKVGTIIIIILIIIIIIKLIIIIIIILMKIT